MDNIIYEVIVKWSNDYCKGSDSALFKNYNEAKNWFEEEKEKIKSFDNDYNTIIEEEDYYEEYEEGFYDLGYNLVFIQEKELN